MKLKVGDIVICISTGGYNPETKWHGLIINEKYKILNIEYDNNGKDIMYYLKYSGGMIIKEPSYFIDIQTYRLNKIRKIKYNMKDGRWKMETKNIMIM